jgi:ActR/RegA family two-component response regulator
MTPYERAQRRWRVAYFLRAAERCGGNCGAAARLIGVHRNTFTRVLQQAGYTAKDVRGIVKTIVQE